MPKEYSIREKEVAFLMTNCLLYAVRSSVRMITLEYDHDFSNMKLFCYLDREPEALDLELMEDAIDLFKSDDAFIMTEFKFSVEASAKSFNDLYADRLILYARYEPPVL